MKKHIVIDARIRRSSTGRPLHELVEHLQKYDHKNRYTILVQPDDGWEMTNPNFTTLPCPFPQFSLNPLNELLFAWQLYRLKPDLIHFGMTQQPLLYFGNIVTFTHDLTMLYHVRKKSTVNGPYWLRITLYKFLLWWSHRKSKKIITFAQKTAEDIAKLHPFTKDKLVVIYEAPGTAIVNAKPAKPKFNFGKYIMYQGTAFPHKNLPRLIEAFDILHKKYPKLNLVLVGKTEKHYEELAELAKKHPSHKNIIFTGFLSDAESKWTFQHAELFVTPTLIEGAGLNPLEAMACGTPVVESGVSVMPEYAGKAAHYFDPYDPEDIAAKISEVLDNKKLRDKLIAAGYKQIKKYSWDKFAKEVLAVYKSLLKE